MKSVFDACCNVQPMPETARAQSAPSTTQQGGAQVVTTRTGNVQTQSQAQRVTQPVTNLLTKVEERVPMVAPLTGGVKSMLNQGANAPENDRLGSNVITGRGEEKQSFGETIQKHMLPTIGIFPAHSTTGLATLRALTGYPNRNTCAKIQCIVRDADDIALVRGELNEHLTDSITWAFADYADEPKMTMAFMGLDRLLIIPPNTEDRAELVCKSIDAARHAGIPHVVLLSAIAAQNPATMFGRQYRKMEEHLEMLRGTLNCTHLRMGWYMDNFLDMAQDIVGNNRLVASWGASGVAIVALADVGRAAAAVMCAPKYSDAHYNRIYHLTGPESLTGFRMAEIFSKVLDRQIAYIDLPRDEMRKVYTEQLGIPQWMANGYVELNDTFKGGSAAAFSTDVAMLTQGNQATFERFLRNKRWYFLGQRSPLTCILPGSGRVGGHTLAALMKDDSHSRLRAIVRTAEKKAELETLYAGKTRLEVVVADLEQPETIKSALTGVDNLLIIPPEKLDRFGLIDDVIKTAYALGVSHTVLFSVSKALDATALGRKFNAWERVLEQNAYSWTVIQSSLFQDLMFHFAEQIKRPGHVVHHWLGTGRFCPVDARDVGEACAAVLREGPFVHHGKTYSLYGPQPLNFGEMTQTLSRVLGYPIEAVSDISMEQVRATLRDKLPSFNVEEVVQAHETIARGHDVAVTPDLIKLTGHSRTIQAFFEDYKTRFQGPPSTTGPIQYETREQPVMAEVKKEMTVTTTTNTTTTTTPLEEAQPAVAQT